MKLVLQIILFIICVQLSLAYNVENCPSECRCTEKTLTCRRGKLNSIPEIRNKRLSYLSIVGNNIKEIKSNAFDEFKDLIFIDLSFNKISEIQENAFSGPLYLQTLDLKNNLIVTLPKEIFTPHSEHLRVLSLANNQLKNLPISLEKIISLKRIDLHGNLLHCGCEHRFFAANLRRLALSQKSICETPETVKGKYLEDIKFEDFCPNEITNAENPPRFITQPDNVYVAIGDKAKFICSVADIENTMVKWNFHFNDSSYNDMYWRNQLLIIREVHEFHAGILTCTASNNKGIISVSTKLITVQNQKPYIIEGPSSISVEKGAQVTFSCRAKGYPNPEIIWLWVKSSQIRLETEGKYTVRNNILIINNVTETEVEGRYVCYASSSSGSARVSAIITLERIKNVHSMDKKNVTNSVEKLKNEQLHEIIKDAQAKISVAFKKTAERLRDPNTRRSSTGIQSLFRQPSLAALELAKASDVYEKVLDDLNGILRENKVKLNLTTAYDENLDLGLLLSAEQLAIISQLSGCQRSAEELHCSQQLCFHKKYRTIDGKCNNLINPRRGSALSPFYRLLKPEYENGINTPIGWTAGRLYHGYPKPSARLVSSKLLRANKITPDPNITTMVMQWGQFLDHDLDFTPVDASTSRFSDGLGCNETCVNDSPCFPILTPPGDRRIQRPCIGFSRSIATCGSGQSSIIFGKLHYREQVNQITSFLDASNVYSSDPLEATELRDLTYDEGKLRVGPVTHTNKRLLPFNIRGQVDCQIDPNKAHVSCFKAGDHRNNENLGLLAMHTIWMREHNRIADDLRLINNHWTGDKIYYETRKIVGAMMQHITYKSWLPIILGEKEIQKLGEYKGYNDLVDSTISSVFATAAMRFGHTLINPILYRLDENFETIPEGNLPLHKAFFAPDRMMEDGGIDPILRGLYARGSKSVEPDQVMNAELIEKLFAMAHEVALDLGALNIQRGRDHGLPSYNSWREFCGLKKALSFDDFADEIISRNLREKMRQVYGHPGNVDLFSGAVLEQKVSGGLVGPTLSCLLIDQFKRLRDGDRFWYESHDNFEAPQLSQIKQVTMARILCDNSDNIGHVQENVFILPKTNSEFIDCKNIPKINLIPWKECYDASRISLNEQVLGSLHSRSKRSATFFDMKQSDGHLNQCEVQLNTLEERIKNLETKFDLIKTKKT